MLPPQKHLTRQILVILAILLIMSMWVATAAQAADSGRRLASGVYVMHLKVDGLPGDRTKVVVLR